MNPVAAQRVSVTTADGLALVTRQIGPEVADMTMILLHGLLGDQDSWRHQTSHLTSRHPDTRVIAYDQRGHGRSGRGCAPSNTLGQLARDLDAVIDTTTPTGHIVLVVTAGFHGNSVRPDITTVPLEGVEPSHVVLATRAGDRSRLVAAFRKLAEAHLTGPGQASVSFGGGR
jgi:alpha/beta hydrolase fold